MDNKPYIFTIENEGTSELTIFILTGDVSPVPVKHKATGYRISDGFLFILFGERVIATYNRNKWISIRE